MRDTSFKTIQLTAVAITTIGTNTNVAKTKPLNSRPNNEIWSFLKNTKTIKWEGPNYALTIVGNYGLKYPKEKQNYSLRTADYRYIRYSNGKEELYHNKKDSYEWHNVVFEKTYRKKHLYF